MAPTLAPSHLTDTGATVRTLHHRDGHLGWDATFTPTARIAPGDELELTLADSFGGQLPPDATADDVARLDLAAANPLTGPVAVDGARAGDALSIEILEIEVGPVGWTAVIPGFGLLADDFPRPHVIDSSIADGQVRFGDLATLPRRAFLGTIGVAPGEPGLHSVIPPRRVGGNLDCRDVRPGTRLLLPVETPDALLSVGDPHAAQGDGEVCGTAVETTATARVRVELLADHPLTAPRMVVRSQPEARAGERWVTTGVGPDLRTCAVDATRAMIDLLVRDRRLDAADAYALCSVAADLRIAEVVDAPNWVVAMEFDPSLLDDG